MLMQAYASRSDQLLHKFYDDWAKATPPRPAEEIDRLPEADREIYHLYQEFYDPRDIKRIGGSEWGDSIYSKVAFCLLQDEVRYAFADTIGEDGSMTKKSIYKFVKDFRPATKFAYPHALVLIPEYDTLLNQFLGNTHYPFGAGNIMSPAAANGESEKRQAFLQHFIRIWYGHWGGYWQLHTYPIVNSVIFNRSFDRALVEYQIVYEGGEALFKKINGRWTLVSGHRTWIE